MGRLYFPIGVDLSPDFDADGKSDFLVIANSNFDLRYRAGSLQTYDLESLNGALDSHCKPRDADERKACGVIPVEDERDDLSDAILPNAGLLVSEVLIGSFADGLALAPSGSGARVYMPVRSEGDLSYVDMSADGTLSCGDPDPSTDFGGGGRHECESAFRHAEDGAATEEGVVVAPDPVALTIGTRADRIPGAEGNFIVMAHRGGRMSLFWETTTGARPELVDTLGGFPDELVEIEMDPVAGTLWAATAFDPVVPRAGIALGETRADSFLFRNSDLSVTGVDTGNEAAGDTRVVRFDPRPDVRRAYVLSRRPRAVLVVDIDDSVGALDIRATIPVGIGPSRMEVAEFPGDGTSPGHTLAFVTCFDSRDLYVIDLDAERLVGIVRSLGGPFELAVDVARERVYVGDFRSSVIRVLDLAPMFECLNDTDFTDGADDTDVECSPEALGFVGRPRAVQELI